MGCCYAAVCPTMFPHHHRSKLPHHHACTPAPPLPFPPPMFPVVGGLSTGTTGSTTTQPIAPTTLTRGERQRVLGGVDKARLRTYV